MCNCLENSYDESKDCRKIQGAESAQISSNNNVMCTWSRNPKWKRLEGSNETRTIIDFTMNSSGFLIISRIVMAYEEIEL